MKKISSLKSLFPSKTPSLTYVSCFVNINCKEPHKTHQWRMNNFINIAETGVPIVLYVDDEIREAFSHVWTKYKNIALRNVDYDKSWTFNVCSKYKDRLPTTRNIVKDTFLFICLMNMKIEFVVNAVNENPFRTQHFAWIDFNLPHIFKNKVATSNYMQFLTTCKWLPGFITIPGCWEKGQGIENIVDIINWRFCGGFMLGDGDAFNELFDLYLEHFAMFMEKYRRITWEVNFWTWLEVNTNWDISWYKADHDDSIVRVPSYLFSRCLADEFAAPTIRYPLPKIPNMYPSSCGYAHYNGDDILNVRYVNYYLDEWGRYHINHPEGHLVTQNVRCFLTPDLKSFDEDRPPENVWEGMIGLPIYDKSVMGLEDVRLYISDGKLKYVATNKSHSISQRIRIMVGEYSAEMAMFENGQIIDPPTDTWCEKNWIPLDKSIDPDTSKVANTNVGFSVADTRDDFSVADTRVGLNASTVADTRVGFTVADINDGFDKFIYRWAPFEIGQIENGTLKIIKSVPVEHMQTQRIRGSTPPVWCASLDCYICVVHYCEHIHGAKTLAYYHMLVKLGKKDYVPFEWSNSFHFNKVGIQYCIGFTLMNNGQMAFWFSEHDGNPGLIIL